MCLLTTTPRLRPTSDEIGDVFEERSVYNHQTAIAVLGSKGEPSEGARHLAAGLVKELGEAGYVTLTSDEHGCLQAMIGASRKAKGLLVLTSAEAETKHAGVKVLQASSILGRLEAILRTADAVVITEGSLESLALLFEVWSYGSSPNLPFRPLILLGDQWVEGLDALMKTGWISKTEQAMVTTASTVGEAVESLRYYAGANNGG